MKCARSTIRDSPQLVSLSGSVSPFAEGEDGGPSPGPSGPPREFPLYQRGPPQEYLDRIAEKRRLEEVSGDCCSVCVYLHVCNCVCQFVCVCDCCGVCVMVCVC